MYKTSELFDLTKSAAGGYLAKFEYPWQALAGLKEEILRIGGELDKNEYVEVSAGVWVHKSAKIAPTAYLGAPCIEWQKIPKSGIARSSAAPRWWAKTAWWAIPRS